MATFAFIGFGELGTSLAEALGRSEGNALRAFTRPREDPAAAAALAERLRRAAVEQCASLAEAVGGAGVILSVVPSGASRGVAEECAPLLQSGSYYVDLSAAPVEDKQAAAALVTEARSLYVDAAVLGTVATSGFAVPILASGPGASGWQALVEHDGLLVEVLDAPAGHATLLKLLRSVYMKGREALIVEMLLAARRYGLHEAVAESIKGPGETVSFSALAERVLCALAVHAPRRAEELLASSEVVRAVGVEPVAARAGAEVLRRVGELELREAFARERPASGQEVLAMLDELSGRSPTGQA
jgi:3-hydroxyisobutyrate dehydrogenase-like beta-hydroxyacid dehydrogenase